MVVFGPTCPFEIGMTIYGGHDVVYAYDENSGQECDKFGLGHYVYEQQEKAGVPW